MAISLAPSRRNVQHRLAALLLLHLAAIVALSTASILHVSARHNNVVHAAADTATLASGSTHDVLVFQTSWNPLVPLCLTQIIQPPTSHEPPSHVLIATPTDNGTYPVILFKHGFFMANCFYTQLFESVAASGYIIVAPQTVTVDPNCTGEIGETAEVANWISESLAVVLNASVSSAYVVPDMSQLVMAGHSRGGKIAFAMALGMTTIDIPSFAALVTLDPVDGTSSSSIFYPPIVAAGCSHSRNQLSIPVLILGTGYGSYTGFPIYVEACAPACCSHMAYFNCSSAPILYHLVASDYGHLDFLDDSEIWTGLFCKGGDSKTPLRNFSAELMVAFLESALQGEQEGMASVLENWESAAITLEEPLVYTKEDNARVRALKRERFPYRRAPRLETATF